MLVFFVILVITAFHSTNQECGNLCKSTCKEPNNLSCSPGCEPNYCQCNDLYLLSDEGKCILPDDCPEGNPCGENKTFVSCNSNCPAKYCPVDDSIQMTCDEPYPCSSGCGCQNNYKRKSRYDDSCILASDCPAVNCTRPNEKWDRCPFEIRKCGEILPDLSSILIDDVYCEPQCVCEEGYARNDNDICVPVYECGNFPGL